MRSGAMGETLFPNIERRYAPRQDRRAHQTQHTSLMCASLRPTHAPHQSQARPQSPARIALPSVRILRASSNPQARFMLLPGPLHAPGPLHTPGPLHSGPLLPVPGQPQCPLRPPGPLHSPGRSNPQAPGAPATALAARPAASSRLSALAPGASRPRPLGNVCSFCCPGDSFCPQIPGLVALEAGGTTATGRAAQPPCCAWARTRAALQLLRSQASRRPGSRPGAARGYRPFSPSNPISLSAIRGALGRP